MPSCCGRAFQDSSALAQHQKAKHPSAYSCTQCSRSFNTPGGLVHHRRDLHDSPIQNGKKKPSPKKAAAQLPKTTNSDRYCGDCRKSFVDAAALRQHRQSSAHAVEFRCCDCERDFASLDALQQHLQDKVHKPKKIAHEKPRIQQCPKCSRQFQSEQALQNHKASTAHRSARNLVCAIGGAGGTRSCNRRFKSPSAMLHHLESGGCPSGMNRAKLNMVVLRNDTERIISSPDVAVQGLLREATRRLATGGVATPTRSTSTTVATTATPTPRFRDDEDSDDDDNEEEVIMTPSSCSASAMSGAILTPSSTMVSATPLASWLSLLTPSSGYSTATVVSPPPGGATRCPLCPPTRRPFPTTQSLQQHLLSPAHDAQIFHCPVSPSSLFAARGGAPQGKATAVKWFSTLSGMAQHLESGACVETGVDFGKAVTYLEARMKGFGLVIRRAISN